MSIAQAWSSSLKYFKRKLLVPVQKKVFLNMIRWKICNVKTGLNMWEDPSVSGKEGPRFGESVVVASSL